ncbi:BA14K family protein [Rhizobium sp. Root708]|uniref:BA14K family protein n=1 Tax=Rhizobium sp. Root708 TaxID=1736592 RepID=UPI0009E9ABA9|nr:BA14K family protein [Rhizobium sp. Root708]
MKTIVTLAFGITCTVGASLGVASVASVVVTEPESSAGLTPGASELWTTTPVKIDRAAQSFERLPAVLSTYASSPARIARTASPAEQNIEVSMNATDGVPDFSADHLNWCASRYRSYNANMNTYRSFSGEMRSCSSPFESRQSASDKYLGQAAKSSFTSEGVVAWCAARYQSYRPADNTYQPYGGQRRPCLGPKSGDEMALR